MLWVGENSWMEHCWVTHRLFLCGEWHHHKVTLPSKACMYVYNIYYIHPAVMLVDGHCWSTHRAKPTSGSRTWKNPSTFMSLNSLTVILFGHLRIVSNLGHQCSWRMLERRLIPSWSLYCWNRPSNRVAVSVSSWETVLLNIPKTFVSTWQQNWETHTIFQRHQSRSGLMTYSINT